jgi:hypothetical protein
MGFGRLGVAALGLLASGTAFAGTPGWSLSESSGQVSIISTGLVKAAVRGGVLATGDVVNTGRNGRAVLVRGEEYLVVAPNTRLRVADPAKTGGLTQIVESFGNVIYKIKKMTMPHFAVDTPFLAAVVKGTTFSVTVTEKGASVQVIEGRVEVATRDGGASFMVLPGDIGSVSATAPGRLNVQGRETRSIESPTPEKAAAAVAASAEDNTPVVEAQRVRFDGAIDAAIGEGSVRLDTMSDGMVKGDSALIAVVASTAQGAQQTEAPTTAPIPAVGSTDMAPPATDAETVLTALPPMPAPEPAPVAVPPTASDLPPAPLPDPGPEIIVIPSPPVAQTSPASPPPASQPSPPPVVAATPPAAVPSGNSGPGNSGNGNNGNGNGNSGSGNNGNGNSGSGNNGNGNGNSGSGNNGNGNGNKIVNPWIGWINQQLSNRRSGG